MYTDYEIRHLPLTVKRNRQAVEAFLAANGLRLEEVDCYAALFACDGDEILAGGGLCGDTIKCVAVGNAARDERLGNRIVSHLVSMAVAEGHSSIKVFTKPSNREIFRSLGFACIGEAPDALFMENGQRGIAAYRSYLEAQRQEGVAGVIVMNANPFTRGHRYLVEQAAAQVDRLYVIAVKEEKSAFSYAERLAMLRAGCGDLANVTVCEGSDYAVSAATFPTYFLKEVTAATDIHIALDLDIFARHIAPALHASVRFVGTEPTNALTARYNERMKQLLPPRGIRVVEVERLEESGEAVSASRLRRHLAEGALRQAVRLAHPSTVPYLVSALATDALQQELDTTPKPGLVDRQDSGAHRDMDYRLMNGSIRTLHPFFTRLACLGFRAELPPVEEVRRIGQEGEASMLRATNGVNTYKGALFALGLAVVAASHLMFLYIYNKVYREEGREAQLRGIISALAKEFPTAQGTHGSNVLDRYRVKGALANACEAYPRLFGEWLPFYDAHRSDPHRLHKTLLCIMSSLEDTNIYFRKGAETAAWVREESSRQLEHFSVEALEAMNREFIRQNISPGGSADMLSLTVFMRAVLG